MRDFRNLTVWQKGHVLALDIHRALQGVRAPGASAARIQLQRSAASIPSNIAEGCGKRSDAEFARYIDIAFGSAKETENHRLFAVDMGWITRDAYLLLDGRLTEVRRMLFALSRVMRERVEMSRMSAENRARRGDRAGEPALSEGQGATRDEQ